MYRHASYFWVCTIRFFSASRTWLLCHVMLHQKRLVAHSHSSVGPHYMLHNSCSATLHVCQLHLQRCCCCCCQVPDLECKMTAFGMVNARLRTCKQCTCQPFLLVQLVSHAQLGPLFRQPLCKPCCCCCMVPWLYSAVSYCNLCCMPSWGHFLIIPCANPVAEQSLCVSCATWARAACVILLDFQSCCCMVPWLSIFSCWQLACGSTAAAQAHPSVLFAVFGCVCIC